MITFEQALKNFNEASKVFTEKAFFNNKETNHFKDIAEAFKTKETKERERQDAIKVGSNKLHEYITNAKGDKIVVIKKHKDNFENIYSLINELNTLKYDLEFQKLENKKLAKENKLLWKILNNK